MKKNNVVSEEKKTEAVKKTTAKKTVAKKAPVKTVEVKQEVLDEVAKAEVAVEEKEVTKKAVVKKVAEKKAVVTIKEELFVQVNNQEILTTDIVEKVKAAYVAEGHAVDSVEKIRVYIKPEENMVYYVVNDDYASGISLF